MFLRFNEGAIVRLELLEPINYSIIGKIIKVLPDEVELCPQLLVYRGESLDTTCTANAINTIHLRRNLVWKWEYVTVSDIKKCIAKENSIYDNNRHRFWQENPKWFSNYTFNTFESDGLCKGNGSYCGNIPLTASSMAKDNFEDDGK